MYSVILKGRPALHSLWSLWWSLGQHLILWAAILPLVPVPVRLSYISSTDFPCYNPIPMEVALASAGKTFHHQAGERIWLLVGTSQLWWAAKAKLLTDEHQNWNYGTLSLVQLSFLKGKCKINESLYMETETEKLSAGRCWFGPCWNAWQPQS